MNYIQFKEKFQKYGVFSIADIRLLEPNFDKKQLTQWFKKGYIQRVARGYYIFSDLPLNEQTLFFIANTVYSPSYVSFESALSYYGFIPEGVYSITSATTKKTATLRNALHTTFFYHTIKPALFFGYHLAQYHGRTIRMAEPEKTILDYFYIHSHLNTLEDMEGMRFNEQECTESIDSQKLFRYLEEFHSPALEKRIHHFLTSIDYAEHHRN
ncbi:MAG: hypothetical protein HYV32_01230 [Candidatus Kerfeldbacteria bacterium]|nr:hypothetical protein [Candidatus Kerfeldbacteria bacterium]